MRRQGFWSRLWPRRNPPPATRPRPRAYDGATASPRASRWLAQGTSGNAEVQRGLVTLRVRSRDLVRNDANATKAIAELASHLAGPGIRPRAMTGDAALDKQIDDLFRAWSAVASADGQLSFYGLQNQIARALLESGEVLVRRRPRRIEDGLPVPLQLQVIEADQLDLAKTQLLGQDAEAGMIVQGVEFGPFGNRTAYWILPVHPGEMLGSFSVSSALLSTARRVAASEVIHVYDAMARPGQVRGVPWLAPVILDLRDLDDYRDAERLRKKAEASLVATVQGGDDATVEGRAITPAEGAEGRVTDADGRIVEEFTPGQIMYAPDGRTLDFNHPVGVGGYGEFVRTELHAAAAGARLPYELMTGDLSQVNFSSFKAGMNAFRRLMAIYQREVLIQQFCRPAWSWWVTMAQAAGLIPDREIPVEWAIPRIEVDRIDETKADVAEVRAGFASQRAVIARRGDDPEDVLDDIERSNMDLDDRGLVLDTDPRKVTTSGAPVPPEEPAADDEPGEDGPPARPPPPSSGAARLGRGLDNGVQNG